MGWDGARPRWRTGTIASCSQGARPDFRDDRPEEAGLRRVRLRSGPVSIESIGGQFNGVRDAIWRSAIAYPGQRFLFAKPHKETQRPCSIALVDPGPPPTL